MNVYAGISATKHNLSISGTGSNHTTAQGQICVFCHTPHAANTGAAVPLWNKALPASNTFSVYNSGALKTSSIQGEILSVGSVSIACLSCHDGSQSMDNMINAPGSGGFTAGGADQNYSWTGVGTIASAAVTNIGKDLTNDHPIGIQFCGGGLTGSGTTVGGNCADTDFRQVDVRTATINSNQVFWVELNGTAGRQSSDISLYTRAFGGGDGPSVECASCHDPHVATKGSDNMHFMRVTTTGSSICLSCHVK